MPSASSLIDVSALWHVALYAFAGTLALTGAYGIGVLALDRMQGTRQRGAWPVVLVLCAVVTVAVLGVGLWAMTPKTGAISRPAPARRSAPCRRASARGRGARRA